MGFRADLHARAATTAVQAAIRRVNSRRSSPGPEIRSAIVAHLS
jgi:hypothetical protein